MREMVLRRGVDGTILVDVDVVDVVDVVDGGGRESPAVVVEKIVEKEV